MEICRVNSLVVMAIMALLLALVIPSTNAHAPAPAPAHTSDGIGLDQGIAYMLMVVALVLTYIIH